ncbi:hypothetical protein SprV_0501897400 [Sparganum proliferum]
MGENGTKLIQQRVAERTHKQRTTREKTLENKFHKLTATTSSKNDKLMHNLLSQLLTDEQMRVLRHEDSFNTADAKPTNMITAVESIFNQTNPTAETQNLIRHQGSFLLTAHRPLNLISKVERGALEELMADNDLVVVPVDKGFSTVELDRTDHIGEADAF